MVLRIDAQAPCAPRVSLVPSGAWQGLGRQLETPRPCAYDQPTFWSASQPCVSKLGPGHGALATPWQCGKLLDLAPRNRAQ
ncbi:hypothetical protein V6N13_130747 [Hibiscus sabdariffa]